MGTWVLTLTEVYGLMKTGKTESEVPGVVPKPELGLEADEVEESVDMAQDQTIGTEREGGGAAWERRGLRAARIEERHVRVGPWTCGPGSGAHESGQRKGWDPGN